MLPENSVEQCEDVMTSNKTSLKSDQIVVESKGPSDPEKLINAEKDPLRAKAKDGVVTVYVSLTDGTKKITIEKLRFKKIKKHNVDSMRIVVDSIDVQTLNKDEMSKVFLWFIVPL